MNPLPSKAGGKVRCAIYTRKSSEEGLEQDFNSLDAQREACAAYVLSQASEGWNLLPEIYDDGGISGGTLERPALKRLLADVAAGQIDIIVVYKVDRLTRSLLDFAKLVETFDKAGTSFVSVTQSFNTTTSMGRLTLNMLLSFAEFEREVTAERIRDKIAASKARGMWMGGTPPLGYRPDGRSLAIVEDHAALVRDIYRRYLSLGTVRRLADALAADGVRTPARVTATGKAFGNALFSRGQLYKILGNPIYAGDIAHKDKVHAGQHPAIIDRATWDAVQALLASHVQGSVKRRHLPDASLLAGLIVDARDEPMLATHAAKGGVRYRYYVSRCLQQGERAGEGALGDGMRLPAREVEGAVKERVASLFDDPLLLASELSLALAPAQLRQLTDRCGHIAAELRGQATKLRGIVRQVRALSGSLEIELDVAAILSLTDWGDRGSDADQAPASLTLRVPLRLTRTGRALRMIQDNGARGHPAHADPALRALVVRAHSWWNTLAEGELDVTALGEREGISRSYITRVLRAAFLSPAVTEAILDGRQHAAMIAGDLRTKDIIPAHWDAQARLFLPAAG
jgi:site-specific DNA recombinase